MKTKPLSAAPGGAGSSPAHRDRRRPPGPPVANSANSDKPPANDKENTQGKYAGIGPDSIKCSGEQFSIENLSEEARSALAEDLSYKLRQLIHNVALHARHSKTPRIKVEDVNVALRLMDTEPVLGPARPLWSPIPEAESYCVTVDPQVEVASFATRPQSLRVVPSPSVSVSWVSDARNSSPGVGVGMNSNLQNYYTKISKALFSGDKKLAKVALRDLSTNTHIGPVIPSIINLALLVLSEVSLITPISHEILHRQALNILDSLLVNPCCCDTDVSEQLQRLFRILVTNVLTESIFSEQILRIMVSIVTIWPQFAHIGRNFVLEYLTESIEERLTGPLVDCLTALGRKALVDGLMYNMPLVGAMIDFENVKLHRSNLYEAVLNSTSVLLKVPNNNYDPKNTFIDEWLYEMFGDAIIPRRLGNVLLEKPPERPSSPKIDFDTSPYSPLGPPKKKSKIRIIKYFPQQKDNMQFYDNIFDYSNHSLEFNLLPHYIHFNIPGCRQLQVRQKQKCDYETKYTNFFQNGNRYNMDKKVSITLANGVLLRFKYKLPAEKKVFPNYSFYTL